SSMRYRHGHKKMAAQAFFWRRVQQEPSCHTGISYVSYANISELMLAEGQILGNYKIVRMLGEGGMGAVFEAVHQEIGRRAAVKVLHPQFAQNAQVAARFLNEAKAANLIEHPGVVEIFEFSRLPDGTTYIVME